MTKDADPAIDPICPPRSGSIRRRCVIRALPVSPGPTLAENDSRRFVTIHTRRVYGDVIRASRTVASPYRSPTTPFSRQLKVDDALRADSPTCNSSPPRLRPSKSFRPGRTPNRTTLRSRARTFFITARLLGLGSPCAECRVSYCKTTIRQVALFSLLRRLPDLASLIVGKRPS
jgi:hypothetical protein